MGNRKVLTIFLMNVGSAEKGIKKELSGNGFLPTIYQVIPYFSPQYIAQQSFSGSPHL